MNVKWYETEYDRLSCKTVKDGERKNVIKRVFIKFRIWAYTIIHFQKYKHFESCEIMFDYYSTNISQKYYFLCHWVHCC